MGCYKKKKSREKRECLEIKNAVAENSPERLEDRNAQKSQKAEQKGRCGAGGATED